MDQQSYIYKFLLTPRFRTWRYLALTVFFTIISLNQALVGYKEFIPHIGNNIYWIILVTISTYIVTVLLLRKLVHKYLSSGRYSQLVLSILLLAFLYTAISNIIYDLYIAGYDLLSTAVLIDNLSSFGLYILCISGVIAPIFLKNWIVSNEHLNELKIKQASSQVEQFKDQINPPSFFKILNKSKETVKTEPDKASVMLMKLSQLLRYQLYDCNQEQVLLTAEIAFLRNFLELEKLYSPKFNFAIEIEGNLNGIFVFPTILLPYVQGAINAFDENKESHTVHILLSNTDTAIYIALKISGIKNNILLQKELLKVKERLNTLYKDRYKLIITDNKSTEITEMTLQLEKK